MAEIRDRRIFIEANVPLRSFHRSPPDGNLVSLCTQAKLPYCTGKISLLIVP